MNIAITYQTYMSSRKDRYNELYYKKTMSKLILIKKIIIEGGVNEFR